MFRKKTKPNAWKWLSSHPLHSTLLQCCTPSVSKYKMFWTFVFHPYLDICILYFDTEGVHIHRCSRDPARTPRGQCDGASDAWPKQFWTLLLSFEFRARAILTQRIPIFLSELDTCPAHTFWTCLQNRWQQPHANLFQNYKNHKF